MAMTENDVKIAASNQAAIMTDAVLKYHARRAAIIGGAILVLVGGGFAYSRLKPGHTPPARERATAKCADGTYSYAYSRQGACATHGGVKVFYK